jgi:ketosteroid isomerase-like protein
MIMHDADGRATLAAHKQLAADLIAALGTLQPAQAQALLHDQYQCEFPSVAMRPDTYSKTELLAYLSGLAPLLPGGIRFEIIEMTAEANRVSTVANGFATTVTGKPYNNRYHFLHYIEAGQIIRQLEFMDSFLGAKVLGPLLLARSAQ